MLLVMATGTGKTYTHFRLYGVYLNYQQLIGQNDAKNYKELFPNPDYFDLVIVDECHRGSAKDYIHTVLKTELRTVSLLLSRL